MKLSQRIRFLFKENPHLAWGGVLVGMLFIACVIGFFYPYDQVLARGEAKGNLLPSWRYWLGTDASGQSILTLLIESTEAFFLPGLLATSVALLGGVTMGAFSGYYGGWFAHLSRYISALINSFPNLILVLLCTTVFGPNMNLIALVVGITFIPHISDEIRRKVSQLKAEEFVMASEAHGLRDFRILFYHIIWLHCAVLIMRQLVFLWGYLIILETSLNYLGQGVLQKGISWGKMLYDYRSGFFRGEVWSPLVVTFVVMLAMAGIYLFAEGLQRWSEGKGILYIDESTKEGAST